MAVNSCDCCRAIFAFLRVAAVDPPAHSQLCILQQMFTQQLVYFPDQLVLPKESWWSVRNVLLKIPDFPEEICCKEVAFIVGGCF